MTNEKVMYRPPMEYDSLILQVTLGCAHNKCTFCSMYKDRDFRIRKISDIVNELKETRKIHSNIKKIFLADGDAFVLKTESILEILKHIKEIYPECTHVASYARFTDVLRKSPEDLKLLRENGLKKLYLGLESGSDKVLDFVNKNSTVDNAIKASKLLKEAEITIYTTVLLGLGGKKLSDEHITKTAEALNIMNPDFVSLMTLLVSDEMELMKDIKAGRFELLTPKELVLEALSLVEKLKIKGTTLRINHASNFVNLQGILPLDKEDILNGLKEVLDKDLTTKDQYRRF